MCYANGGQAYTYIVGYGEKKHTDHMFPSSACEPLDQRCVFRALVSRWINGVHTDRVFLSSACEPLDQRCVSFERL